MRTKSEVIRTTYTYANAHLVALDVHNRLRDCCERLEIAGSLRRGKSEVHDIDLVALARYHDVMAPTLFGSVEALIYPPVELLKAIHDLDVRFVDPPSNDPKILYFSYQGMPVEVYLAERDGSNYEALLQMRTGSANFNTGLAVRARARGMYYRAGYGVYEHDRGVAADFGRRLDDGAEAGIFTVIGMDYRKPSERV